MSQWPVARNTVLIYPVTRTHLTIISFADDINLNTNVVTKAKLLHLQTVGHLQLGAGCPLTSTGSLALVAASTTSSGASKFVGTGQVSITGDWTAPLSGDLTIISGDQDSVKTLLGQRYRYRPHTSIEA